MDGTRKSIRRLALGGIKLTIGALSEEEGVPADVPLRRFLALSLVCLTVLLDFSPSGFCFFRPVGGLSCWVLRLRTPAFCERPGLDNTFLEPGGLPGFLFFVFGLDVCPSVVITPSLSPAGTLSVCSKLSRSAEAPDPTAWEPSLLAIGIRSRDPLGVFILLESTASVATI